MRRPWRQLPRRSRPFDVRGSTAQVRWLNRQFEKAQAGNTSWLSRAMQEVIPFNRPHRLRVTKVSEDECVVVLPRRRRNLNHLGTMHACALATAAEYASGLTVLSVLGIGGARLIMSNLNMTYVRRAESECQAHALMSEEARGELHEALGKEGKASFVLESRVLDAEGEVVATAEITWHVKLLSA